LNVSTLVEPIGMPAIDLHADLAKVYSRVQPAEKHLGEKMVGTIRDLRTPFPPALCRNS
jgi:hypothetical protein